jgi:DNA-binding transcriptional LysR family regulator
MLLNGLHPRAVPMEELAASIQRRRGDTTRGRVVVHVASVCPTCFRCLTRMLQGFRADVAKVDLDFSTLRMLIPKHKHLIPDVAIVCFRMLQLLLTYFLCCKY